MTMTQPITTNTPGQTKGAKGTQVVVDFAALRTKSGKGVTDFEIPKPLFTSDPQIIQLVMSSESMNDGERQYWFNLTEIMSSEQVEKLRDILVREREKLAEIEAKYGKPKVKLSAAEVAKRNTAMEQQKAAQQQKLASREQAAEAAEAEKEAEILAELENM